ncbi:hypothetical protein [Geminocystis sp. NIES-3709]|uniref:hypothetical protein n=1 Tax=Geminocystis sp. NIES-3709 TaxID=1617448 RepID=UPI0005FC8091|nr:hypothetical protein [Geminocystis sp. NIES-3709]BAQ67077.1 hypothetical protein GM3709_3842 [Geminocystis sp. NIES-3709]
MTLADRKIPILSGVNSTPSSTGQPKHPNASLLCKQFNDLIDNELTDLASDPINATEKAIYTSIFVDSATGNDTTGEGTELLPFATIQKAIDSIANHKIINPEINIAGTFIDPIIDTRKLYPVHYGGIWETNFGGNLVNNYVSGGIKINGGGTATILYTNGFDNVGYEDTDIPPKYVYGRSPCTFSNLIFDLPNNEPFVILNNNVLFENCIFDADTRSSWSGVPVVYCIGSMVKVDSCSFNCNDTYNYNAVTFLNCIAELKNLNLTNTGSADFTLIDAEASTLVLLTDTTGTIGASEATRNTIFVKQSEVADDTALTAQWGIDPAKNLIKYI